MLYRVYTTACNSGFFEVLNKAELLPFADGQRAADDLPPAVVQHQRLAQVGDQEDQREQKGEHTGQPIESIERDMDRDRFMSAEEAKEYGIIDNVISKRSDIQPVVPAK